MAAAKGIPRRDELRDQLREAGLRATAPRIAVMDQLLAAASPLSHAEIVEQLGEGEWDRATIYRNLMDLTEAGLVRRTDLGDHVYRFELRREQGAHERAAHPHFLCDTCGEVLCLPDTNVKIDASKSAPRSLRRGGVEVQLRGQCDRCG